VCAQRYLFGTIYCESLSDHEANAAAATGDEGNPALDIEYVAQLELIVVGLGRHYGWISEVHDDACVDLGHCARLKGLILVGSPCLELCILIASA
jgi:hypothetical protein